MIIVAWCLVAFAQETLAERAVELEFRRTAAAVRHSLGIVRDTLPLSVVDPLAS
jgi:hypothetical protein